MALLPERGLSLERTLRATAAEETTGRGIETEGSATKTTTESARRGGGVTIATAMMSANVVGGERRSAKGNGAMTKTTGVVGADATSVGAMTTSGATVGGMSDAMIGLSTGGTTAGVEATESASIHTTGGNEHLYVR